MGKTSVGGKKKTRKKEKPYPIQVFPSALASSLIVKTKVISTTTDLSSTNLLTYPLPSPPDIALTARPRMQSERFEETKLFLVLGTLDNKKIGGKTDLAIQPAKA